MHPKELPIILALALLAAACGASSEAPRAAPSTIPSPGAPPGPTESTTMEKPAATSEKQSVVPPTHEHPQTTPGQRPAPISEEQLREELTRARFSTMDWPKTNFQIHSVPLREFRGGGPGKDDIPPIDRPKFETVAQADQWLDHREPVQVVEIQGDARAYPQQILVWHEIVNDAVGGEPVTITY